MGRNGTEICISAHGSWGPYPFEAGQAVTFAGTGLTVDAEVLLDDIDAPPASPA